MDNFTKVTVLDNEIEAQIITDILSERHVPHILKSYYSGAYDGMFQFQKGWGAIYAPEQYHAAILEVLTDLRNQQE